MFLFILLYDIIYICLYLFYNINMMILIIKS